MHINNCLVITKQTALAQGGRAATFARKGDETAKRLLHADGEHKRAMDAARRALKSRKIAFAESSIVPFNAALKRQAVPQATVSSVARSTNPVSQRAIPSCERLLRARSSYRT